MFKCAVEVEKEVNSTDYEEYIKTCLEKSETCKYPKVRPSRDHFIRIQIYTLCDIEIKKMDNYLINSKNVEEKHNREEEIKPLRVELKRLQKQKGLH